MPEQITTKYEAEKEEAREMMQLFQGLEHDEKATVKGMILGIKLVREVKEGKSAWQERRKGNARRKKRRECS